MIKGRDGNRGPSSSSGYSADLLVCFPPRTHLALTPKPISSPSRPSDSTTRRPHHRRQHSKLSGRGGGGGHGSPVLWAKQASSKNRGRDEIDEPTSPKVTCAGQIKVRPSKCGGRGKNWRSVMEEIERIQRSKPQSKFFGVKKDVMGFLTCLRNIRFDFRCFGDFRHADVTSDDEDDDDGEEEEEEEDGEEEDPKNAFSKWFMVLQEEQSNKDKDNNSNNNKCVLENSDAEPAVPPPNALLLMRCRSAPAKSWLEERMQAKTEQENREKQQEEETEEDNRERQREEETEDEEMMSKKDDKKDLRTLVEEEKMDLVLMRYDTDYYKLSSDIAKETWVVGGNQDPLSRSRSWRS
ncbi:unnamed protein product [Brassica rapa]|uniref:ARID domain-containing protein n=1 Tax=Brassica campestris TaxID=3711 RepID=A0A3P6BHR3_BRACM|nr:unnamed protein product [Brassica rapa]VDD00214.1 unnamed protein product [Brassica rapa]